MRNLLATLAILGILAAVGFYAAGWLQYRKTDSSATIELQTRQIEDAAKRSVEEGRELLEDVIEEPLLQEDPEPVKKPNSPSELEGPVTSFDRAMTFVA